MKKIKFLFILLMVFNLTNAIFAKEEVTYNPYELDYLLKNINKPTSPIITDDYIIFTAETTNRYVGIAFDFENYQIVHPFKLFSITDEDGKKVIKHLFYCYERKHKTSSIKYRLVIDGLWTTDPLNPTKEYDETVNLYFSRVDAPGSIIRNTETSKNDVVHFVYEGEPGQEIRLAGTFTGWDPWIYKLTETRPGFYELELPLTTGKHYYNYYVGLSPIIDKTNPQTAYTKDGRRVSVITIN